MALTGIPHAQKLAKRDTRVAFEDVRRLSTDLRLQTKDGAADSSHCTNEGTTTAKAGCIVTHLLRILAIWSSKRANRSIAARAPRICDIETAFWALAMAHAEVATERDWLVRELSEVSGQRYGAHAELDAVGAQFDAVRSTRYKARRHLEIGRVPANSRSGPLARADLNRTLPTSSAIVGSLKKVEQCRQKP